MKMNAFGRASSVSPSSGNDTLRGARPPPPVRPKPKRTITVPVLMDGRSEIRVIEEKNVGAAFITSKESPSQRPAKTTVTTSSPTKGTVKALAERFEVPAGPRQPAATDSSSFVRSAVGIFEAEAVRKEPRRQRNSVVATVRSKSLSKFGQLVTPPTPPPRGDRQASLPPSDTIGASPLEKPSGNSRVRPNIIPDSSKENQGSLERRRQFGDAYWIKKTSEEVVGAPAVGLRGENLSTSGNCCKPIIKKRSRSCDVLFDKRFRPSFGSRDRKRRRGNSADLSNFIASASQRPANMELYRKLSPPEVPPKPPKRLSAMPSHEYAAYDILPPISPPAIVPTLAANQKQGRNRRSTPADRFNRQLPDEPSAIPSQLYDSPARYSLEVRSDLAPALSTMELLDESQLNISGHIYCAVRHGEVIEDECSDVIGNGGDSMIQDESVTKRVCQAIDKVDNGELSFSAEVFDAIELAMGQRIAEDDDDREDFGDRVIEEDAMTNYEEIMDDVVKDNDTEEVAYAKLPEAREPTDQNCKWETCSTLTSTSAESGSSSSHAPMLIAYRRRSSDDWRNQGKEVEKATKRATGCLPNDFATPDATVSPHSTNSYYLVPDKRDKEAKSTSRVAGRSAQHTRPKSQLDTAANSLWRIKSDIQLNLSQAMGKIRLKVSSGASPPATNDECESSSSGAISSDTAPEPKKLDQKARSTFYLPTMAPVDAATTKNIVSPHPTSISITLEAGLADELISSTAASSDEDEDDENDDTVWSGELETQRRDSGNASDDITPVAAGVGAPNLPDLVPQRVQKKPVELSMKSRPLQIYRSDDTATTDSGSPTTDDAILNSAGQVKTEKRGPMPNAPESSCSSTVASGIGELERFELIYNSRFAFSEPLYQHYRSQTSMVQRHQTFSEGDGKGTISRRDQLLNASQLGSQRTLWCELPEVRGAGLLQRMSDDERKLQEAMFELITSEASYLRSLNILITQFMASPHLSGNTSLGSVVTKQQRKQLFSNILAIRDCSERLLCALEGRLEENVMLMDVCDLLYDHLRQDSDVYVKYCSNQIYQERTLNELRRTNSDFRQVLGHLELNPVCECLNLRSFLMLPMQRVTRYPLLVAAILQRTQDNGQLQTTAQRAYAMAGRVVRQCNEGAKRLERIEQLVELDQSLIYREGGPKRLAFVSGSRWLIKKGLVIHLQQRRHTLGVRGGLRHQRVYLFLFTDLLLITKPTDGEKRFVVKDYCQRQFVEVSPLEPSCPQVPDGSNLPANSRLILITLMKNHRGRQVQFVFNCETETDKTRWLDAVRPSATQDDGEERIYEPWDCPQVRVVSEYHAMQEDELDLEVGDVINVLRKMPDGWYEGERLRDGEKGWFPSTLTEEILSDHIRAKNYRDRLRFINEAEQLQRTICTGDGATSLLPSSSTGTTSRRNSIIPTAAKALFRL